MSLNLFCFKIIFKAFNEINTAVNSRGCTIQLGFAWKSKTSKCSQGFDPSHSSISGSCTLCEEAWTLRVIAAILKEVAAGVECNSCSVINRAEVSQLTNFKKFGVWVLFKEDPICVPTTLESC